MTCPKRHSAEPRQAARQTAAARSGASCAGSRAQRRPEPGSGNRWGNYRTRHGKTRAMPRRHFPASVAARPVPHQFPVSVSALSDNCRAPRSQVCGHGKSPAEVAPQAFYQQEQFNNPNHGNARKTPVARRSPRFKPHSRSPNRTLPAAISRNAVPERRSGWSPPPPPQPAQPTQKEAPATASRVPSAFFTSASALIIVRPRRTSLPQAISSPSAAPRR